MCGLYYVKILKITELVYSQGKPFIYYIIGTRQTVILAFCLSLKRFRTSSHASVRYSNSNIKGACFNRFVCESVTLHDAAVFASCKLLNSARCIRASESGIRARSSLSSLRAFSKHGGSGELPKIECRANLASVWHSLLRESPLMMALIIDPLNSSL